MKIVPIFALYAVILIVACFSFINAQTASANSTRKLQITENSNPQVSYGEIAFDEITVESNLNIRAKNPASSRSQRTQLYPIKKANGTDDVQTNDNKPNNIKLSNA